jgi:hypothetical protein
MGIIYIFIVFRWAPKIEMAKPIPLTFANVDFDYMIDFAFKNKKNNKNIN